MLSLCLVLDFTIARTRIPAELIVTHFGSMCSDLAPFRQCRRSLGICDAIEGIRRVSTSLRVAELALPATHSSQESSRPCRRQQQHDHRVQEDATGARQQRVRPPADACLLHKPNNVRGVVGRVAHDEHGQGGHRHSQHSPLAQRAQVGAPDQGNASHCAERRHDERQNKQHDGHLQAQRQQNVQLGFVKVMIAGQGISLSSHKVVPIFSHQNKTEVKDHHDPQHSTDETRKAGAAVSFVDNREGNAEVASHRHRRDEQAAAVQRGEEEEAIDWAQDSRQRPVLKHGLRGLNRQPQQEQQVGHAQVEGVDHVWCGASLAGLADINK